eukprot:g1355.t1
MMKCVVCKKRGATIGCAISACKANYHFCCIPAMWDLDSELAKQEKEDAEQAKAKAGWQLEQEQGWIQCSACDKWRRVPLRAVEQLEAEAKAKAKEAKAKAKPAGAAAGAVEADGKKEQDDDEEVDVEWTCSMNEWARDPQLRSCEAPEEDWGAVSTKAADADVAPGCLLGVDYPAFLCAAHAGAHWASSLPHRQSYIAEVDAPESSADTTDADFEANDASASSSSPLSSPSASSPRGRGRGRGAGAATEKQERARKKHCALSVRQAQQLQKLLKKPKLNELQPGAAVLVLGRQQQGNGCFDEELHRAQVTALSKEGGGTMVRVHYQGGGEDEWIHSQSHRLCKPFDEGAGGTGKGKAKGKGKGHGVETKEGAEARALLQQIRAENIRWEREQKKRGGGRGGHGGKRRKKDMEAQGDGQGDAAADVSIKLEVGDADADGDGNMAETDSALASPPVIRTPQAAAASASAAAVASRAAASATRASARARGRAAVLGVVHQQWLRGSRVCRGCSKHSAVCG